MAEPTVFIVDNDEGMRESLRFLLESVGFQVVTYPSAEEFVSHHDPLAPGCLLLDVRMPNMTGLELQEVLEALDVDIPIIMMSAYGDVQTASRAFRRGALEFLEKPFTDQQLLETVNEALAEDRRKREEKQDRQRVRNRIDRLTAREKEVLGYVAEGMQNKAIATKLGRSPKTVA